MYELDLSYRRETRAARPNAHSDGGVGGGGDGDGGGGDGD